MQFGDALTGLLAQYRERADSNKIKEDFVEITDSEEPIWVGRPTFFSMIDRYLLIILVFSIHILFYWSARGDDIEGDGRMNFILGLIKIILDFSGAMGFVIVMLILTKINHYLNFSTSGRWTTIWLILNSLTPILLVMADWLGKVLGLFIDNVPNTPEWSESYYLFLGAISSGFATVITIFFQKAFSYAITDKRIHIRKKFLYFDTSIHGISFSDIENLKAEPSIVGRLLGFGNVFLVTASGIGLESKSIQFGASVSQGANGINDAAKDSSRISSIFGWISLQRRRNDPLKDPEACLFGINDPMEIYQLINEIMDAEVGPAIAN